jgi:hypothetical protein
MNATITDTVQWVVSRIKAAGITVYEGVAPQTAKYPFVVVNPVGSLSQYSLGGDSGIRIDEWIIDITCYDNSRLASDHVLEFDQMIGLMLENQFNVVQKQSVIMNADRGITVGPKWLDHENYWMLSIQWHIRVTANGTLPVES